MAITIEDGTGLSNAEAYVSVADCDTYHSNRGNAAWTGADSVKEEALRKATAYLEGIYAQRFVGTKGSSTQALSWPRENAYDRDGVLISGNALPQALVDAQAELALRALSGDLAPDVSNPGAIRRKRSKVGPIETETEYSGGASDAKSYRLVGLLLRPILTHGRGTIRA